MHFYQLIHLILSLHLFPFHIDFNSLAVQYLSKFSEFLPSLSSAHLLVKLLVAICKTTKSDEHLKRAISEHTGGIYMHIDCFMCMYKLLVKKLKT